MAPKYSTKGYLMFLRIRRLGYASWRNYMLDKFCSGMSNGTVDYEFNINELTIYIKQSTFEQKHT